MVEKAIKGLGHPKTTKRTTQACFEKTALSPDPDKWYSCIILIPFNSTKGEELQVLRHILPKNGSYPFKEPYNLDHLNVLEEEKNHEKKEKVDQCILKVPSLVLSV